MPKQVKFVLTIKPGGTEETLRAEFPDEDWAMLQDFLCYSQELERTHLVLNGIPGLSFGFKQLETGGMTGFATNLPADDHLAALLHRMRPFLHQKERTNFNRVCNILARRFNAKAMRTGLAALKELYSSDGSQRLYTLVANGKTVNSEEVLMKWLNAYEYHRDAEKRKELAGLYATTSPDLPKAVFVWLLHSKVKAILMLAFMIQRMSEDNGSVVLNIG